MTIFDIVHMLNIFYITRWMFIDDYLRSPREYSSNGKIKKRFSYSGEKNPYILSKLRKYQNFNKNAHPMALHKQLD